MITSGGLGTMGYGLPAAIGAKVARPDCLVIGKWEYSCEWSKLTELDVDGDASFSMTLTELSTAAQFNIGVKILVLNNEEQGMSFLPGGTVTDQRRHGNTMAISLLRGQIRAHTSEKSRFHQISRGNGHPRTEMRHSQRR